MKKKLNSDRRLKSGIYSILISVIMAAVVAGVNLVVSALPQRAMKIDTTAQGIYSLSDQTESVLNGLSEDIDMFFISEPGKEDDYTLNLLKRYADVSDRITVTQINPLTNPTFSAAYSDETVEQGSVIVVSGDRSRVVKSADMYAYGFDYDYYTYSTVFNGETLLTGAVRYVTDPDVPVIYALSGHGEKALPEGMDKAVAADNIFIKPLELISGGGIPEDAAAVALISPASDITGAEKDELLSFADGGGSILLVSGYSGADMPNLYALMAGFGMEPETGVIIEGDERHSISGYAFYLLPDILEHEITAPIKKAGESVLMPAAMGVKENSHRSTLSVYLLLETSYSAYLKSDPYNTETYVREEGDASGPFYTAAASEEVFGDTDTRAVWFASDMMMDDQVDAMVSGGNADMFVNAAEWLLKKESDISVRAKSTATPYLTLTTAFKNAMTVIVAAVLPLIAIVAGAVIFVRRRRRK